MYPHQYFGLFPPFAREHKVFVAMSFDPRFDYRWENVIAPAIKSVKRAGVPFEPHRVDAGNISDSILTEIECGIANDRLIIADITTLGHINDRPARNSNVMYEVGLAHAGRLPEEVLLFRSDSDEVLFDIANVKINSYDPDNDPDGSQRKVAKAILEAIKEIDLKCHLAVKAAVQSLDVRGRLALAQACTNGELKEAPTGSLTELLDNGSFNAAIRELLRIGALSADGKITPQEAHDFKGIRDLVKYIPTQFGLSMNRYIVDELVGDEKQEEQKNELLGALNEKLSEWTIPG